MATFQQRILNTDTKIWGTNFSIAQFPNAFERLYDSPLDVTSIWPSLEDAKIYAKIVSIPKDWLDNIATLEDDSIEYLVIRNVSRSYKGQVICVVEANGSELYLIDEKRILKNSLIEVTEDNITEYEGFEIGDYLIEENEKYSKIEITQIKEEDLDHYIELTNIADLQVNDLIYSVGEEYFKVSVDSSITINGNNYTLIEVTEDNITEYEGFEIGDYIYQVKPKSYTQINPLDKEGVVITSDNASDYPGFNEGDTVITYRYLKSVGGVNEADLIRKLIALGVLKSVPNTTPEDENKPQDPDNPGYHTEPNNGDSSGTHEYSKNTLDKAITPRKEAPLGRWLLDSGFETYKDSLKDDINLYDLMKILFEGKDLTSQSVNRSFKWEQKWSGWADTGYTAEVGTPYSIDLDLYPTGNESTDDVTQSMTIKTFDYGYCKGETSDLISAATKYVKYENSTAYTYTYTGQTSANTSVMHKYITGNTTSSLSGTTTEYAQSSKTINLSIEDKTVYVKEFVSGRTYTYQTNDSDTDSTKTIIALSSFGNLDTAHTFSLTNSECPTSGNSITVTDERLITITPVYKTRIGYLYLNDKGNITLDKLKAQTGTTMNFKSYTGTVQSEANKVNIGADTHNCAAYFVLCKKGYKPYASNGQTGCDKIGVGFHQMHKDETFNNVYYDLYVTAFQNTDSLNEGGVYLYLKEVN